MKKESIMFLPSSNLNKRKKESLPLSEAFEGSLASFASALGCSGAARIGTGVRISAGDVIDRFSVTDSFSGVELLETEADLEGNKNQESLNQRWRSSRVI